MGKTLFFILLVLVPRICLGATSFRLTSSTTGTVPFTVGIGFKKGDVATSPVLDVTDYQVVVKKLWNDGSVKHAIAAGYAAVTAGTPLTVNVAFTGSVPSGTALTASDIATAAPTASVQCGAVGTVSLGDLLASPARTWLSGPEMVEAHYQSMVGASTTLAVWFHVRLYRSGEVWVRAIVDNGMLDIATSDQSYVPTVTVGGATVYNNGGASLTHYAHTRWSAEGWIGITDPAVKISHDTTYLMTTKLVPNYWKTGPSEDKLNSLYQTYTPNNHGDWHINMANTGPQNQIGLLPVWDALYLNSNGDTRAFDSVIANSKALNAYAITWNDTSTNLPVVLSARSTWTVSGAGGGGVDSRTVNGLTWERNHHGSGGYLSYIITGDYYHLELMQQQATLCYLTVASGYGSGTSRILLAQTRGVAWIIRTIGQLVAIAPADSIVSDLSTLLSTNVDHWNDVRQQAGQNLTGYLYSAEVTSGIYGTGLTAPWQQAFWVQTYGLLSDIEPLASMTNLDAVRDYLYASTIGILGGEGTSSYCYDYGAFYTIKIAAAVTDDVTSFYDSWGTVYEETHGAPNGACGLGRALNGTVDTPTSFWANLLPAVAYAVEDTATGAFDSWDRITSASNWSVVENCGFADTPQWGIYPRTASAAAVFSIGKPLLP